MKKGICRVRGGSTGMSKKQKQRAWGGAVVGGGVTVQTPDHVYCLSRSYKELWTISRAMGSHKCFTEKSDRTRLVCFKDGLGAM